MFNSIYMRDNHNKQVVRNSKYPELGLEIDTCYVNDGYKCYETGIKHPQYDNGNYITVEAYDTVEEATDGHYKWVTAMTGDTLPEYLIEYNNWIEYDSDALIVYNREDANSENLQCFK